MWCQRGTFPSGPLLAAIRSGSFRASSRRLWVPPADTLIVNLRSAGSDSEDIFRAHAHQRTLWFHKIWINHARGDRVQ